MTDADQLRQIRAQELRALIVHWQTGSSFSDVLDEQTKKIDQGEFTLNEDWCIMADEILGAFLSGQEGGDGES